MRAVFAFLICVTSAIAADSGVLARFIEVRSRPQPGFTSKPAERLILHSAGKEYVAGWDVGFTHNAPKLSPELEYVFVLIERSNPAVYGAMVWHDIWRVSINGRTLYDYTMCEVHRSKLRKVTMPTVHGYAGPPDVDEMVRRTDEYPHSLSGRPITCMEIPGEGPTSTILVCDSCERAYQDFQKEPNQAPQRNAGSRPSSDDSPASGTPSSLGPRG
jgi:hypothetical protein